MAVKGDVIKTELVELSTDAELSVTLPEGSKNSELNNAFAGEFAATVGGLDDIAADENPAVGESVTITLIVTAEENVEDVLDENAQAAFDEGKTAIAALPETSGKTMEYISLTLEKTVDNGAAETTTDIGDANTKLLTIIIPYNTSGKKNITVYRYHGTTAVAMQKNPAANEEGFTVGDGFITIYARSFSTYAIGYNVFSSGGGGGGAAATYSVTTEAASNGTVKADRTSTTSGTKVTLTITPAQGYTVANVTVKDASGNTVSVTKNADGTYSYTQPASNVTVSASYVKEGACPQDSTCPMAKFPDLKLTEWYHDGVHWALENGVMNGVGDSLFAPNGTVTRAMVMTMLARMESVDTTAGDGQTWYDKGVAWAMEKGISDGTNPTASVTREQFATMLYRYAKLNGQGFTGTWMFLLDYPDAANVSEWADEAMHWMVMQGVINGMDGKLNPQGEASRAQIATMLMRYSAAK